MSKDDIKKKIQDEVNKFNALQKATLKTLGGIELLNKMLKELEDKENTKEEEKVV